MNSSAQKVNVCVQILQGRGLPIKGLQVSLSTSEQPGATLTTNDEGIVSGQFMANSTVTLFVYSKTQKALEAVGQLDIGPYLEDEDQWFSAIIDLIKVGDMTAPHPRHSREEYYPVYRHHPTHPSKKSDDGTRKDDSGQGVQSKSGHDASDNPINKPEINNAKLITLEQMQKMWPDVAKKKKAELQAVADELNSNLMKYRLDTPLRKAHFFAQVMIESGPSFSMLESTIYHKKTALNTFGRINTYPYSEALKYCKDGGHYDPVQFANYIYYKWNGNGDAASGDGYRYRGRGLIQLTGKSGYEEFNKRYEIIFVDKKPGNFIKAPDLISQSIRESVRSSVFFWIKREGSQPTAYQLADKGDSSHNVREVTRCVNGGYIKLAERQIAFKLTRVIFK